MPWRGPVLERTRNVSSGAQIGIVGEDGSISIIKSGHNSNKMMSFNSFLVVAGSAVKWNHLVGDDLSRCTVRDTVPLGPRTESPL
jgi:hypothetical protein